MSARRKARRCAWDRIGLAVLLVTIAGGIAGRTQSAASSTQPTGIHKIRHVIVLMQENRSFDSYFGTFPGADGIPFAHGAPAVCIPDPTTKHCVAPYVNHADVNGGGPHSALNAAGDIDGGKMDGFMTQFRQSIIGGCGFAEPRSRRVHQTSRHDGIPHGF